LLEEDVHVRIVYNAKEFGHPHAVIIPGTKSTLNDLDQLRQTGLDAAIRDFAGKGGIVFGICGGYQMMHHYVKDYLGTESKDGAPGIEKGINFIGAEIEFKADKILKRQEYTLFEGIKVHGFEMHTGISDKYPVFFESEKIKGSMVHEIFHDDDFRNWWLTSKSKPALQKWNYKDWKKSVQDGVSIKIKELVDFERMLG